MTRLTVLPYRRRLAGWSWIICFCGLVWAVDAAFAAGMMLPCCSPADSEDLTGLSLEELYNLDIVQPNVLGGHTHPAGQTMFGYDYMHTTMSGIYEGSHTISPAQAFAKGFPTVHTEMQMDMHMFDLMQAPTEWLTLMAMVPYKTESMLHQESSGNRFYQYGYGFGDLELMGMFTVLGDIKKGGNRLVLNLGASLPTGRIDLKDHKDGIQSNPRTLLEYPMQLGSGTFDPMPGLTYLGDADKWSWGAQTLETIRLGRNYHDYRLGNEYELSGWVSYGVTKWFAPSLRLDGRRWGNIHGADPGLAENPTPEARPDLRSGQRIDALFGINFYAPKGFLKGIRASVEGGLPVFQNLNGPQLGTSWMLDASVTYAF